MKKRRILRIEQLEARETPDVSLGHSAAYPIPPVPFPVVAAHPSPLPAGDQFPGLADRSSEATAIADLLAARGSDASASDPEARAVERLFADSSELQGLLPAPTSPPSNPENQEPSQRAPASKTGELQSDGFNGRLLSSTLQGCRFLCNYARKAIRNDEARYGSCPDHEDTIQQVFVEWREQVGTTGEALSNLLNKDSPERQLLRKTVRRIIDHARYEQVKQRRIIELIDQPAAVHPDAEAWMDLQIDLSSKGIGLSTRQKMMLELRSQGKTFDEIGSDLGLAKQRVFEIYESAIDHLQELYMEDGDLN